MASDLTVDLELWHNDEPVCPYCGHKDDDAWELPGDDGEGGTTECGECEREYRYRRHVRVTYTTAPLEEATP